MTTHTMRTTRSPDAHGKLFCSVVLLRRSLNVLAYEVHIAA